MRAIKELILPFRVLLVLSSWTKVTAEPVQFCKVGSDKRPNQDVDFCLRLSLHENTTSSSQDLYLTLTHTRRHSSALGWTAIGTGSMMEGALMFFIYGDPQRHQEPVLSVRTTTGHHRPTPIHRSDTGGGDIQFLSRPSWLPSSDDNSTYTASISLVYYSCTLWTGTQVSQLAHSQPWIWAWNGNQHLLAYSDDVDLEGHSHQKGAGGWGRFYVDIELFYSNVYLRSLTRPARYGV